MHWIIEDTRQQTGKHNIKHEQFDDLDVGLERCKLPVGDYAPPPRVAIDTKRDMDEIAANICGSGHTRFVNECKLAKKIGTQLIILVENDLEISDISQVHTWANPRSCYSDNCVQGPRLQKAMETIQDRYGAVFLFCNPEEAAARIMELIKEYGGKQTT